MQLWVLFAAVLIGTSETRHYYPYESNPSYPRHVTTTAEPYIDRSINDVTVVDEKTGIKYNPYSKHHPGRHVCTIQRNVTYPMRTKRVFCKPTYKKYMVRCGTQWCEGVRLVYEKYHKEMVVGANHTLVDYTCCPGWTQISWNSHGCNKPVCHRTCMNGGSCVKPNYCLCPKGYVGTYCETKTSVYAPTPASTQAPCVPPCQKGTCSPDTSTCTCPPGYTGRQCERDIDECRENKPCDQICKNTPGSYSCGCKEDFVLQKDGQTCRKERDEGTTLEATDLEGRARDVAQKNMEENMEKMEKRIEKLEKDMSERRKNEVTKNDLDAIYDNINKISVNVNYISKRIQRLESQTATGMDSSVTGGMWSRSHTTSEIVKNVLKPRQQDSDSL